MTSSVSCCARIINQNKWPTLLHGRADVTRHDIPIRISVHFIQVLMATWYCLLFLQSRWMTKIDIFDNKMWPIFVIKCGNFYQFLPAILGFVDSREAREKQQLPFFLQVPCLHLGLTPFVKNPVKRSRWD